MELSKQRCGNCRFGQVGEDGTAGECRRHAPRDLVLQVEDTRSGPYAKVARAVWPRVGGSDWCGDWQERG